MGFYDLLTQSWNLGQSFLFLLTMQYDPLYVLCGSRKNCGKFSNRREYQTIVHTSWEACMQVKKQQLELGMEQWTGSK